MFLLQKGDAYLARLPGQDKAPHSKTHYRALSPKNYNNNNKEVEITTGASNDILIQGRFTRSGSVISTPIYLMSYNCCCRNATLLQKGDAYLARLPGQDKTPHSRTHYRAPSPKKNNNKNKEVEITTGASNDILIQGRFTRSGSVISTPINLMSYNCCCRNATQI